MGRSYSGPTEIVRFGSVSFLYPSEGSIDQNISYKWVCEKLERAVEKIEKLERSFQVGFPCDIVNLERLKWSMERYKWCNP